MRSPAHYRCLSDITARAPSPRDYRNGNQLTTAQAQDLGGNCGASVIPAVDQTPYLQPRGRMRRCLNNRIPGSDDLQLGASDFAATDSPRIGIHAELHFCEVVDRLIGNYAVSGTSFNGSSHQDGYNIEADYGPSAMDVRHSLNSWVSTSFPSAAAELWRERERIPGCSPWRMATRHHRRPVFGTPVTIFGPGNSNTNSWGFSRANQYRQMTIRNRSLANWWEPILRTALRSRPANPTGAYNGTCAYGVAASNTFGTAPTAPSAPPATPSGHVLV